MKKLKQVSAIAIVILWGMLLLTTLIVAFIQTPEAQTLFKGLIFTDIALPVVAYAIMLMYKYLKNHSK